MAMQIFGLEPKLGMVTGYYKLYEHSLGLEEKIPVALVSGSSPGPTISLSANLHGNEYTGTLVIQELLKDSELVKNLKGKMIFLPSLNPYGGLRGDRFFSFTSLDPNRLFPNKTSLNSENPTFVEIAMQKLFFELKRHTSLHIDLHCSKLHSIPFTYVRPSFSPDEDEVIHNVFSLAKRFGLFVVRDNPDTYFTQHYDRTLAGSLIGANIPAFTVELGSKSVVETSVISRAVEGIKKILITLGMLDASTSLNKDCQSHDICEDYFMNLHPICPSSAVVRFLVKPGDFVHSGQIVASICDVFGNKRSDGFVRSDIGGLVLCAFDGAFFEQNKPLLKIASKTIVK